jgi:hypothetical protein
MFTGKLVFAQLMEFLRLHTFRRCVARYPSKYPTKTSSHFDQYLSMAFAQLTFPESLRDIEVCLRAHETKLYHLGIRGHIARRNLGNANEKRDWRIYRDFANALITEARKLYANDAFAVDLDNTVYALDTTTIDLSLKVFPWAHFRTTKAAVKMHTQIDLRGNTLSTKECEKPASHVFSSDPDCRAPRVHRNLGRCEPMSGSYAHVSAQSAR